MRRHVRFSTQPMPEPDDPADVATLIEMMGSDEMLMFATDYPHWDFDAPERALPGGLEPALRRKIMWDNAAAFYRLSERGDA